MVAEGFGNKLVEVFFKHQIVIKMFHFQTKKYAAHKTLDCYLCKFSENFDRFMESFQGVYGRLTNEKIDLSIDLVSDLDYKENIDRFKNILLTIRKKLSANKENDGLISILDDMVADVQQLLYLLTFE